MEQSLKNEMLSHMLKFMSNRSTNETTHMCVGWDFIIMVIESIEKIDDKEFGWIQVHITGNSCSIYTEHVSKDLQGILKSNGERYSVYYSDPNAIFDTKYDSTVYIVGKFCEWYNSK